MISYCFQFNLPCVDIHNHLLNHHSQHHHILQWNTIPPIIPFEAEQPSLWKGASGSSYLATFGQGRVKYNGILPTFPPLKNHWWHWNWQSLPYEKVRAVLRPATFGQGKVYGGIQRREYKKKLKIFFCFSKPFLDHTFHIFLHTPPPSIINWWR